MGKRYGGTLTESAPDGVQKPKEGVVEALMLQCCAVTGENFMVTAEIVRSYWVSRINADQMHDRCGFVYEAGDLDYLFFRGNHIHIPSDFRPINSPQYVEYFWICI